MVLVVLGSILPFYLVKAASTPTLSSPTASNITATSVTLGAYINSAGDPATILTRGTCVTTSPPALSNCIAEGGTATGVITQNRTGLSPNTLYYFSGYARNATGINYTNTVSFTTTAPVPVVTVYATPTKVAYGGTSKITWTSTNATYCVRNDTGETLTDTAGNLITSDLINGFNVGPLNSPTTFTITCSNTPINGVCNNTVINSCSAGTPNDAVIADDVNYYKWRCDGSGGGINSGTCQKEKMVFTVNSRSGGANIIDPKTYYATYSICDNLSGPFTHSMATQTSTTPIGVGTQLYIFGTTVVSNTKAVLPALDYWWENVYFGIRWFKTATSNTIWEVDPSTGIIINGTRSCP